MKVLALTVTSDCEYVKIIYVNCGLINEYRSDLHSSEHFLRSLHQYGRGHVFKTRTDPKFFSGLIFSTAKVVFITPNSLLKTTVHRYDFYIFTVIESSLHGFIREQHNDHLSGLIFTTA